MDDKSFRPVLRRLSQLTTLISMRKGPATANEIQMFAGVNPDSHGSCTIQEMSLLTGILISFLVRDDGQRIGELAHEDSEGTDICEMCDM